MVIRKSATPIAYQSINFRLIALDDNEAHSYKFTGGFKQTFPVGLEEISEEKLNQITMKKFEDMNYYPLIIKIVRLI